MVEDEVFADEVFVDVLEKYGKLSSQELVQNFK